jgi:signal transduction histidine kinase
VLSNLLSHAIKYNRPGGHVRARLSLRQDQLFQPFNRLGLVIVKQMIDAPRGQIQVRSRPDVGTTFVVEWPVARA